MPEIRHKIFMLSFAFVCTSPSAPPKQPLQNSLKKWIDKSRQFAMVDRGRKNAIILIRIIWTILTNDSSFGLAPISTWSKKKLWQHQVTLVLHWTAQHWYEKIQFRHAKIKLYHAGGESLKTTAHLDGSNQLGMVWMKHAWQYWNYCTRKDWPVKYPSLWKVKYVLVFHWRSNQGKQTSWYYKLDWSRFILPSTGLRITFEQEDDRFLSWRQHLPLVAH